jgi:hypothetical protein
MTTMNKTLVTAMAVLSAVAATAGPLTSGNLVVLQFGADGGAALTNAGTPVRIKEYDMMGGLVQTIAVNDSGAGAKLVVSGTATSEGQFQYGGGFFAFTGYNAVAGAQGGVAVGGSGAGTTITNSSGEFYPRVVGLLDMAGNVDLSTQLTESYTQSNIRAAVSPNGTDLYIAGTGGTGQGATAGVRHTTVGGTSATQLSADVTNIRVVGVSGGQLYGSSQSGAFLGVYSVGTGLPTTGGNTCTLLPGLPDTGGTGNSSTYDFEFVGSNVLYTCDDRSVANGGGLIKWVNMGGTWTIAYRLTSGLGTVGTRSVCRAGGSDSAPVLAVVTGEGSGATTRVMLITDSGTGLDSFALIATSPTNTSFRGVEYVPNVARTIAGSVDLEAWEGDITAPTMTFEVVSGMTVVDTEMLQLDLSGNYSFNTTAAPGVYDIYCKGPHWLRRKVGNVTVTSSGASGVNFMLLNGDVDDDNEITIGDYSIMSANFGTSGPDGDVNGDGEVSIGDFAIISSNFGLVGD